MYLYELALELDEHSTKLATRAREAGLVGAGPSTLLTSAQIAALRGGVPMPPPPMPAGAPAPTSTPGALTWGGGAPSAAAPPPPPPPGAAAPSAVGPGTAAPGVVSSLAPPPGPPRGAAPGAPVAPAPFGPGGPSGPAAGGSSFGATKVALVVVAALVVVGIFGYFVLGSTDGNERRRELAAENARIDAQTKADAAAEAKASLQKRFTDAVAAEKAKAGPAGSGVVDKVAYCGAIPAVNALESGLINSLRVDWQGAIARAEAQRPSWRAAVDAMVGATEGSAQADVVTYRTDYTVALDRMAAARSAAELQEVLRTAQTPALQAATARLNASLAAVCR
ncbi:hypothetical protein KSP35_02210 [Aquihabitans sp. G128]|uniref:hypothetical protein n=1 Tax=Aquihabitans sp. G128 TaxID=2849779 RepID=UPI001C22B583|nr:hypothetical protein [Aquihabitans sp. G128]QXC61683.1 hypothetical protein KSP35_02210 [Aquihabitans sp. G128]